MHKFWQVILHSKEFKIISKNECTYHSTNFSAWNRGGGSFCDKECNWPYQGSSNLCIGSPTQHQLSHLRSTVEWQESFCTTTEGLLWQKSWSCFPTYEQKCQKEKNCQHITTYSACCIHLNVAGTRSSQRHECKIQVPIRVTTNVFLKQEILVNPHNQLKYRKSMDVHVHVILFYSLLTLPQSCLEKCLKLCLFQNSDCRENNS